MLIAQSVKAEVAKLQGLKAKTRPWQPVAEGRTFFGYLEPGGWVLLVSLEKERFGHLEARTVFVFQYYS